MAQNHSVPPVMVTTSSGAELLQAQAELCCHALAYLKSMALQSVIKLGIPTAIHRCGGAASLSELHAHLPVVPASKLPSLSRLMKLLVTSGVFGENETGVYFLTPVSRLLMEVEDDDAAGGRRACLSPLVIVGTSPFYLRSSQRLPVWMEEEGEDAAVETPFMMAHGGAGFYGYVGRDMELGALFNEAMGADSRVVAEIVVRECGEVFAGSASLVDVGGGDGTCRCFTGQPT